MSKSEDKMVKQGDQDSQEQTENKRITSGNRKDPPPCPPCGGCESVSYHSPDLVKQSGLTESRALQNDNP